MIVLGKFSGISFSCIRENKVAVSFPNCCLLYTSDAADERSSVDLGGRRIIKKKKNIDEWVSRITNKKNNK